MDGANDVHSIYTDFSRAFDKVSHKLLLYKMSMQFGFKNNVLLWFESYLRGGGYGTDFDFRIIHATFAATRTFFNQIHQTKFYRVI